MKLGMIVVGWGKVRDGCLGRSCLDTFIVVADYAKVVSAWGV